jgi:hypothetical protein
MLKQQEVETKMETKISFETKKANLVFVITAFLSQLFVGP